MSLSTNSPVNYTFENGSAEEIRLNISIGCLTCMCVKGNNKLCPNIA